jgi:outer membrane protein
MGRARKSTVAAHHRDRLIALVGVFVLAGCASVELRTLGTSQPPPPSFPAPAGLPDHSLASAPDHPLSLDEAVALALERNPDFLAAAERIAEAEAGVGEVTSGFYPQVGARLGYVRTDNPAQAFSVILNQRRFSFDLDFNNPGATQNVRPEIFGIWPLFRGGQDHERRQASLLGVEAAKLERLALRNALSDAVIGTYCALVAAPEQVEAARASIAAVSSALRQAQARFSAGAALKSDVLSLDVRLAEARENEVRAQNGVELARAAMRTLLALPPEAPIEIAGPTAAGEVDIPPTFAEALQRALTARPELGAASRQVAMREHELQAERAAYLPRVDAVGSFGNDSSNFELSHTRDSWTFGAAAEIDVFSGFRTREKVRAAERRLAAAREAERKARLDVENDVRTAFLAVDEARQRTRVATAAVTSADDALQLVQTQYEAGTVTITRYLEAEAARTAARSRAIAARYDLQRAGAALRKSMGAWASDGARAED